MASKWVERVNGKTDTYAQAIIDTVAVKYQTNEVMYSPTGASFQEWALRLLDAKGSVAHKSIGKFVTMINNNELTIGEAEELYFGLLSK